MNNSSRSSPTYYHTLSALQSAIQTENAPLIVSTNPTQDEYIDELCHKHELRIKGGLLLSSSKNKMRVLAIIFAVAVFWVAALNYVMVRQINKIPRGINRAAVLWREVKALREEVAQLSR